jgi:hypothetical protein
MKVRLGSLALALMFLIQSALPALAQEMGSAATLEIEQERKDLLSFQILRDKMLVTIRQALEVASKTGTVTTLDQATISEVLNLILKVEVIYKKRVATSKFESDKVLVCSSDLTLPFKELSNCRTIAQYHAHNVYIHTKGLGDLQKVQQDLISAQERIQTSASIFVKKSKELTITCIKGKLSKKVTAVKPKCPSGYKLKK